MKNNSDSFYKENESYLQKNLIKYKLDLYNKVFGLSSLGRVSNYSWKLETK